MTSEVKNDATTDGGAENGGRISAATGRVRDGASAARDRAAETYGKARERAGGAYEGARERAGDASQRAAESVQRVPELALVGGLVLGGLVAALLPRTDRERQALGPYGRKINETAREATRAATETGRSKLDELGFNKETARDKLKQAASSAGEAARSSAKAAAQTVSGSHETL